MSKSNDLNKENQNNQVVEDPIDNTQRVLIRNTVTGFEQGIAAVAGLFTGGPIAAIASWGAIRGLQGKWTPWFVIGIPLCAIINLVNFLIIGLITASMVEESEKSSTLKNPNNYLNVVATINLDDPKFNKKLS